MASLFGSAYECLNLIFETQISCSCGADFFGETRRSIETHILEHQHYIKLGCRTLTQNLSQNLI